MKKQQGHTLLGAPIAMLIVAALGASGLYDWQHWQQQWRLWQTARRVQDYLLQLREDVNWRNRDYVMSVIRDGTSQCFVSSAASQATCRPILSSILTPSWDDVETAEITPSLALSGLYNTARAGHIRLKDMVEEWRVMMSGWGRIRLCERNEVGLCQQTDGDFHCWRCSLP